MSHSGRNNENPPRRNPPGGGLSTHSGSRSRSVSSSCISHRPAGVGTPATALPSFTVGTEIKATDINTVRSKIANEIRRWNRHSGYNKLTTTGSAASPGSALDDRTFGNLANTVHRVFGINPASGTNLSIAPIQVNQRNDISFPQTNLTQSAGDEITVAEYRELVREYNIIRQNCICDTDCACNSVCACNNDCGCNYS